MIRRLLVGANVAGLLLVSVGAARAYVPVYCDDESPVMVPNLDIHTPMPYHVELTTHPTFMLDGQPYFHPVHWAQTGLALIDAGRLDDARIVADDLWAHQDDAWFEYDFDWPNTHQQAPWRSGMAQGQALGLLARLGELDRATAVYRTLLPGSPVVSDDGWLLEYVGYPPVLNGAIFAIFGLYDYWQATGDPTVRQRTEDAIAVVARDLNRFRNPGDISSYEMNDEHRHALYHAIHVAQLHLLSQISGMQCLEQAAQDFDGDA